MGFLLLEKTLTQCQAGTDWDEIIQNKVARIIEIFGNLFPKADATHKHGIDLPTEFKSKLSRTAMKHIAESIIPIFHKHVHGLKRSAETVQIRLSELTDLIKSAAFPKPEQPIPKDLKAARGLLDRYQRIWNLTSTVQSPTIELPQYQSLTEQGDVQSKKFSSVAGALIGPVAGVYLTKWSWLLNQETLYKVLAQSDFKSADPLQQSRWFYDLMDFLSAITAITVDSASISSSVLTLLERGAELSAKFVPGLAKVIPGIKNA